MQQVSHATFTDSLIQLRQALAGADPLAAHAAGDPVGNVAEVVAATFAGAADDARLRFLLGALDDAIAAVEVVARLADALHAVPASGPGESAADVSPLEGAYRTFAEAQTTFQALYHYRNAIAAQLRLTARNLPAAPQPAPAEPAGDGARMPAATERKPARQRMRNKAVARE
jgi:hypothetical protein